MITNEKNLARLESVELREIWDSESGDFTPWLAQEENLVLLGEAIDVDLEMEAQEKEVGPFRADILCKDAATNAWVIVENQLESTDHVHLGQLLTYAAGLKATTIVWIAKEFTDQHRAALDWLNEVAGQSAAFFGVQVELWRIGGSPPAPKFNVVCRPNPSSTAARSAAEGVGSMSERQELQRDYWTALRTFLLERKSIVAPQRPQPACWTNFAIGRAYFGLSASVNIPKSFIKVEVVCYPPHASAHLNLLKRDKDAVENEVGCPLEWRTPPNRKTAMIVLRKDGVDPANRDDWPSQHAWMAEKLEALRKTFAPRIRQLDLDEQQEPDDE
jgi:hypothetical protein